MNISEFLHQELVVVDKINTKLMLLCGKEEIDKGKQVDWWNLLEFDIYSCFVMLQMLLVSSITWIGPIQVRQLASMTRKIQKMEEKKQSQNLKTEIV